MLYYGYLLFIVNYINTSHSMLILYVIYLKDRLLTQGKHLVDQSQANIDFFSCVRTKSSIILWRYYIQFELNLDNTERAKNLFYRSLRECPWSKGILSLNKNIFKFVDLICFLL
jgi:hypothetical protein